MSYNRPNKAMQRFQMARHIGMGVVLLALAYPVARYRAFGSIELSRGAAYTLAGLMILYGLFRVWRGIQDARNSAAEDEEVENERPTRRY